MLLVLLVLASPLGAQQKASPPTPDALAQSVEQWMRENLDDDVLEALAEIDQQRVRQFFAELQRRFAGTSVYDLASLKDTAGSLLPVLDQFEETRPYAVWLKAHLDFFDAAEELRRERKPPSQTPDLSVPPIELERKVWSRQLLKRPPPRLAQVYIPRLKQIFTQEGVPPELAWVAEVESSFDPQARSPAGAAGLFQLMPTTAHTLQLAAWPRDERLEPDKNARAAARYLRSLYRHYGNWPLALAAYNAGPSRVDQLLKKERVRTYEGIASRLPAETQMYVPKVEATLRKREAIALSTLKLPAG